MTLKSHYALCFKTRASFAAHHDNLNEDRDHTISYEDEHTGAKQNLTQNGHSRSFNVTCFGVSGRAIRDDIIMLALFVKIQTM